MGFFSDLKRKKIVFNPKPFSNQKNKQEKTKNMENQVDFHLELTKKIDEVITKNKEDEQIEDNKKITSPRIIEIRQPFTRSPEISSFQTDINTNVDFGELDNIQEFIEIEPPTNFFVEKQPGNKDGFDNWMINNQNEKDQKTYQALGALKIRIKDIETENKNINKNNETTLAKIELEETKKEIERKKKELEEALKKEKEKEHQVKKEEVDKRKQEKLKKLLLKKKLKEEKIKIKQEKIKEKLVKKAQLEKEIELKRQELLKESEEKVVQDEKIIPDITNIIEERKEFAQGNLILDEDVVKLLPIIDSLFEKLPEDVVDEFTKSEYFELYEKVLLKYKNK